MTILPSSPPAFPRLHWLGAIPVLQKFQLGKDCSHIVGLSEPSLFLMADECATIQPRRTQARYAEMIAAAKAW